MGAAPGERHGDACSSPDADRPRCVLGAPPWGVLGCLPWGDGDRLACVSRWGVCAGRESVRGVSFGALCRAPYLDAKDRCSDIGSSGLCLGMRGSCALLRDVGQQALAPGCGAVAHCVRGWSNESLRRNVAQWPMRRNEGQWVSAPGCGAMALCAERWSSGLCVGMRGSGSLLRDVEHGIGRQRGPVDCVCGRRWEGVRE